MAAPLRQALGFAAARGCSMGSFRGSWRRLSSPAAKPKWKLFGALCLQRPPILSQARSPEENKMSELLQQIEMEKSLYSDHEIRCMAEEKNLQKSKDQYGDEEEDDSGKKIMLAQDLEEMWEQNLQKFNPAPRITDADKGNDLTSLNRRLDQNLWLLVKQKVGPQEIWLLPQTEWQDGETLRGTAGRALTALSEHHIDAKFLGNAPCGFYKYRFPKVVQSEGSLGAKVFFFKALLQRSLQPLPGKNVDYIWVSKGELVDYLKPDYHSQVSRFLVDL